jgi:transposase-like protein
MFIPIKCPTQESLAHLKPNGNVIKKGYYITKYNSQKTPRYFCKCCNKHFSTHTEFEIYKQKRPDINESLFNFINSGVGVRRMATYPQEKIQDKEVISRF